MKYYSYFRLLKKKKRGVNTFRLLFFIILYVIIILWWRVTLKCAERYIYMYIYYKIYTVHIWHVYILIILYSVIILVYRTIISLVCNYTFSLAMHLASDCWQNEWEQMSELQCPLLPWTSLKRAFIIVLSPAPFPYLTHSVLLNDSKTLKFPSNLCHWLTLTCCSVS